MLQAMRNKMHGWPSIVLLGVCVFAMSFFGIETYFMSHADSFVAKVGKQEISQQDFQNGLNRARENAHNKLGDQFDATVFEKPEVKLQVLGDLIDQQLLLKANDDWGLRVPDEAIRPVPWAFPESDRRPECSGGGPIAHQGAAHCRASRDRRTVGHAIPLQGGRVSSPTEGPRASLPPLVALKGDI